MPLWRTLDRIAEILGQLDGAVDAMDVPTRIAYADALASYLSAAAALHGGSHAGWLIDRPGEQGLRELG